MQDKISIHRWCGNAPKSWDYTEYKALVEYLSQDTEKVLILWDMGDPEPILRGENIINMSDYADELSIGRSYELMRLCCLHIGADSMPMHLATAAGIPVIAIFERTLPSTAAPYDKDAVIASSNDALVSCPTEFLIDNMSRLVRCGLGDVKAEHILPILEKMEILNDPEYQRVKRGTCLWDDQEIVFPEDDRNIYDPVHFREQKVINALSQYLRPDESVFIDVGANVGLYSLLLGDMVKKCIAIEPFADVHEMLTQNLAKASAQRGYQGKYTTLECALSDRATVEDAVENNDGNIKINWTPRGTAVSYISDAGEYLAEDVVVKTLDSLEYCPDIVKIDVEGAELKVLHGAVETLKTARVVMVELHRQHNASVIAFLKERDFNLRFINQNYILATAKDEDVLPYPVNCLYDPAEKLTAEINEPGRLAFAQLAQDETYWFETFGVSEDVKKTYYDKIGFVADGIDGLVEMLRRNVNTIHVNFLYSETGEPTRYKGEMVYPLNAEALAELLKHCAKYDYYRNGETDWNNVDLTQPENYPYPDTQVTRGRLLLSTDIPF